MSIKIIGNSSGNVAEVDSNNQLKVVTSTDKSKSGFTRQVAEVDPGDVMGSATLRELDATSDYALRVAEDNILFSDSFSYTTVNTSVWAITTSTMTVTFPGGTMVLNGGSSTTAGNVARVQTWSPVPLYRIFPTYIECDIYISAYQANNVCEWGAFIATGTSAPTDGVGFRLTAAGNLVGFQNVGGTEVETAAITKPTVATSFHSLIVVNSNSVEFWIDGVMVAKLNEPSAALGHGIMSASAAPLTFRNYNNGTPAAAVQMRVSNVVVSTSLNTSRPFNLTSARMGLGGYQAPPGQAAGQTANYSNSAAPASATLSNTAAGYTTSGGQWQFAAVAGAETDYALFAYQNPAGTSVITGRNMVVTGVSIDTWVMGTASATTPTLLQWAVAGGSSAVSLATAESATAAGKAPRRIAIGAQSIAVGTAVGAMANQRIDSNFEPLIIEPGTFFHIILKMPVGTATASEIIRGIATVKYYYEA